MYWKNHQASVLDELILKLLIQQCLCTQGLHVCTDTDVIEKRQKYRTKDWSLKNSRLHNILRLVLPQKSESKLYTACLQPARPIPQMATMTYHGVINTQQKRWLLRHLSFLSRRKTPESLLQTLPTWIFPPELQVHTTPKELDTVAAIKKNFVRLVNICWESILNKQSCYTS